MISSHNVRLRVACHQVIPVIKVSDVQKQAIYQAIAPFSSMKNSRLSLLAKSALTSRGAFPQSSFTDRRNNLAGFHTCGALQTQSP